MATRSAPPPVTTARSARHPDTIRPGSIGQLITITSSAQITGKRGGRVSRAAGLPRPPAPARRIAPLPVSHRGAGAAGPVGDGDVFASQDPGELAGADTAGE